MVQRSLLLLFCCYGSLYSQKTIPPLPADTLAIVGNSVITARDLLQRTELMPWEGKETPLKADSAKIKALNSLVAERLLAMEGGHQNVGMDEQAQLKVRGMEKMFVRDELFTREVKQKVMVSENEIREGLAKFAWQLHVIAVSVKDLPAGDSLYRMLQRNLPLPAALSRINKKFIASVETVQVNFGGLDSLFEDAVYAIGRKKFSRPFISSTYGWTVAVILDRGTNPVYEKMNSGDRRTRVDETIRRKKEQIAAGRYFSKIISTQKAQTDSALFFRLAASMREILAENPARERTNGLYAVTSVDVDRLITLFANDLQKPFIDLPAGPVLFGEAIESIRNLRFGFPSLEPALFPRALNAHLRTLVESEVMSREGYKNYLQYADAVKKDLQTWEGYWKSRYLMWRVNDSVGIGQDELNAQLKSTLPSIGSVYEVNIQEVLSDSLRSAQRAFEELGRGVSLDDVARTYSRRSEWRERGGISNFMPLNRYPELSCPAFLADTGTIVGPIKTKEGYSFFKVLGKRGGNINIYPSADSVGINIRNNLLGKKRSTTMNSYVSGLAKKYSIDIRYEKLSGITIQPANMVVRRMIGFGGIITAVPMLYPNWEWMTNYRETSVIP